MELFSERFLQLSATHFNLNQPETPYMTTLNIDDLINDAQEDVPSDQFVPTPAADSALMFVKPGSTKIVTGEKDGKVWAMYTSRVVVDEPAAREATNLEAPTARIAFFLDITEESTAEKLVLVKGVNRNTQLGKLLKATGNDKSGWTYSAIENVPFKGKIVHRADRKNAERVNAEVVAFARA